MPRPPNTTKAAAAEYHSIDAHIIYSHHYSTTYILLPFDSFGLLLVGRVERSEVLGGLVPGNIVSGHNVDGGNDSVNRASNLSSGVSLSKSDRVVLDGVKVNSDTEGSSHLIVSGVSLTDRSGRVVNLGGESSLSQLLGHLLGERSQLLLRRKGNNEDLGGGHSRGERQNTLGSGGILGSSPEAVLNERVQDSANTERGLDDVGGVVTHVGGDGLLLNLDVRVVELGASNLNTGDLGKNNLAVVERLGKVLKLALGSGLEPLFNGLGSLLEQRAELLLVVLAHELVLNERLVELLLDLELDLGSGLVDRKIVGRSVSTADTLDPAVRGLELGIPTVSSVMGHLVGHVLSESESLGVDTNLDQEQVDSSNEVTESLVVDQSGLNGLADGKGLDVGLTGRLDVLGEESELDVLDLVESVVVLVEGIDKVLDLSHGELSDSQKARSGGNLVSERLADGGRGKGHLGVVAVKELVEVEELSLGSLGPKEALELSGGANGGLEHEVELHGLLKRSSGDGVDNLVLLHDLAKLGAGVAVNLGEDGLVLLLDVVVELDGHNLLHLLLSLLGGLVLLLGLLLDASGLLVALEPGLEHLLDQMVGSEDLARGQVSAHPVGKLVDVARGLEHLVGGQHGGVDLEHVVLEHKVVSPRVDNSGLEGASGRAVVVQTGNSVVDLKGGGVEESTLENSVKSLSVELLVCGSGGHSG